MKPITTGQIEQCATVFKDAARKGTETSIAALKESGTLNSVNLQRILERGDHVVAKTQEFIKNLLAEMAENATDRLKLISGAETLTLEPTTGEELTIGQSPEVFNGWIDDDFKNWGLNVKSKTPTQAQNVQVHEMTKDGTFNQIYGGLGNDLNALCLSQAQIIQFVTKHRKWLREDGYGTFFLFKGFDGDFFVAYVFVGDGGRLYVYVDRVSDDSVWVAGPRYRFVVPQLALAVA